MGDTLRLQILKEEEKLEREKNRIFQHNLRDASVIIDILHEGVQELPNEYVVIGRIIYDAMSRYSRVSLKRQDVLAMVGGFLILRFVNPFFTDYFTKKSNELTASHPKEQKRLRDNLCHNWKGFTKILQDLSNGTTQDEKGTKPYLVGEFKPYYETLLPKMANYLLESIHEKPMYGKGRKYDVMEPQPELAPELIPLIPMPKGLPASPEERLDLL